jgi:hypothetical protein
MNSKEGLPVENLSLGETVLVIIGAILALCGFITTVGSAVERIVKVFKAAKAPADNMADRITALETWQKTVNRKLENDQRHFESIDASNRVTQVALLALLDHGIDGNNIDQMQHAKDELQTHLINR